MTAIGLEALTAAIAIPSGISLLTDPSGTSLEIQNVLKYLPLKDFTPVGLWLLIVYGAFPLAILMGLWWGKSWAREATLGLSVVEIAWIAAQFLLLYALGPSPMQFLLLGIAAVAVVLMYLPSDKAYFAPRSRIS
jgi:hypothetical protein